VPQPGYIGEHYGNTRILLVGQNPGRPSARLLEQDRSYTSALRALRDVPTSHRYAELHSILVEFIPLWPINGRHFPLVECGLGLADIAYCNVVRCRTTENAAPDYAVTSMCRTTHLGPWLDMLRPRCVVFIGLWASNNGAAACSDRGIPSTAVNRDRSLSSEARARNRAQVVAFVRELLGSPKVPPAASAVPQMSSVSPRSGDHDVPDDSPRQTLALLDELQALGFPDDAFSRLHHFWPKRERPASFRAYCRKTATFAPFSRNRTVHRRLAFVLQVYRERTLAPGNAQLFIDLAAEAAMRIP
jgi:hypothetical protein